MNKLASENTHTTIGSWALAIDRALQKAGIDPAPIFKELDIDRTSLKDTQLRIPLIKMWSLWKKAVQVTGDSAFGLSVADCVFSTHLGALLFAVQSSSTLREGVDRLMQYAKVVTTVANVTTREEGKDLFVQFESFKGQSSAPHEPIDAFMGLTANTIRDILGQADGGIREVRFCHPAPASKERYTDFFKCPVSFNCEQNEVCIKGEVLNNPLLSANSELADIHDQLLGDYLKRLNKEDICVKVKKQILTFLPSGEVSQEKIAIELNMSIRNLRRKLAQENTTFKTLLDGVRKDLALRYLNVPSISISKVTEKLCFENQSSFTRAFRRWTNNTPTQYRKTLKAPNTAI